MFDERSGSSSCAGVVEHFQSVSGLEAVVAVGCNDLGYHVSHLLELQL